jgi:AraC-like DNA-binding protein
VHKALINPDTFYERCIISIDSGVISAINSMPPIRGSLDWMQYVGESITGKVNLNEKEHAYFMNRIYQYNNAADEMKKISVLLEILSVVSYKFKNTPPVPVGVPESVIGKALLLIEEDFRDIKISELSKRLYVSNSHFSKLFTEQCGVTPINYLLLRKIAEAKKYLYMGISVKEASVLSGFSDYSNFIRTFKKIEGCSPGNFENLSKPL